ncbi:c-type cytochrome [Algoriphagus halophilus]|uniref:Cytochrome c n=1 Tax=Algoriphagus halophilus TaxID=226505 RepID=A0A1N6HBD2_9BACT|nr:c-type cytochrome [Algoriphagus halophilus]SIO17134.1 cytochrome c [Algoriphagus halophilus]
MTRIFLLLFLSFVGCTSIDKKKSIENEVISSKADDYFRVIEGQDEEIDTSLVKRGEILIAYSDCLDCHKIENRAKGPAFLDISKRYPYQEVYIDLLSQRIISGGNGSWGYPVMSAHPNLTVEDSKAMAAFVLSMENLRD